MDVESVINSLECDDKLKKELLENLSKNVEKLVQIDSFFEMSLDSILSISSLIQFTDCESDPIEIIKRINRLFLIKKR